MIPTFSYGRAGRCHRYYVASDLQLGPALAYGKTGKGRASGGDSGAPRRLPAVALEAAVLGHLRRLSQGPQAAWAELRPSCCAWRFAPATPSSCCTPRPCSVAAASVTPA